MRRIEEAQTGREALGIAAGGDIDIAFVDFKLGGHDGLDFCRRIRTDQDSPDIYLPLVMVTAYSERRRVLDAINAGVETTRATLAPGAALAILERSISEQALPFCRLRRRKTNPGER